MEVALMGRRAGVVKPELFATRKLGLVESGRTGSRVDRIRFDPATGRGRKGAVKMARSGVRSEMAVREAELNAPKKSTGPVRLFVGLPLDAVSDCNAVNHAKAIAAGLRALKLLGAQGVELPVWWGVAAAGEWSAYLALADMVRDAGLRLRVSLHLHASRRPAFPLPDWVSRLADANPDLLFTDRSGRRRQDCLSLAVDNLPVLDGKTPLQAFEEFFRSFRSAFSDFIGSTITDISVSLGPNGELRYPSFPPSTGSHLFTGVGEFQCYDKYMLADLKRHAEESGNPLWGLSGPHNAPEYDQSPDSGNFFRENGGSWETPYGNFFLSWYSGQLLSHGDRMLSTASKVFGDLPVTLSAKVPLLPWWHDTRSRPAQLTAGFYNTYGRDGYDAVGEMFARNSCAMIIPGMDLLGKEQPHGLRSSPESLLSQIMKACEKHGVRVSGENSSLDGIGVEGFRRIKEILSAENSSVDSFTYHRMGAFFFSPEHWPLFMEFVRSMAQSEMDSDDLPSNKEEKLSLSVDREMQAA
ncbi:inactive beta-amylase 9 [Phoenix dactylifera]|uniref:Beta-amylase n=1 Tax=Phoenix dactylifera TaxID=42345 RepID=A0A8B7CCB0_PHODC|nr:inactive beta-amylase 9 [Phoenix dactylifera]